MWAGRPYAPRESDAPLTVPDDVELATEARAADRDVFDAAVAASMAAQEVRAQRGWGWGRRAGRSAVEASSDLPLQRVLRSASASPNPAPAPAVPPCAPAQEERRRQAELKRKRDAEEEREYRKTLVFKARPMPRFDDPFFSLPSDKPPTQAVSPKWTLRRRDRGGA
jgi:hypothetical protein